MINLAIFELYQATLRSECELNNPPREEVHKFILKVTGVDQDSQNIKLRDFPQDLSRSHLNEFIGLSKDLITNINGGFPKSQELGKEYYECHKLLFMTEILNSLLYRRAALMVAEYLVKRSEKYYFLNISFQAYRIIYSVKKAIRDEKGEKKAVKKFKDYLQFYNIEKSMEIDYNSLMREFYRSNSPNSQLSMIADEIMSKYEEHLHIIPSFYFHNYYFNVQYIKYIHEKNHGEVFITAKKALIWFDDLKFDYIPGKIFFTLIQVVYLIQKREYDEALRLTERALSYVSTKSPHWFRIMEQAILVNLHRGEFSQAVEQFFTAINKQSFVSLSPQDAQRWVLYEAYINLAIECGAVEYNERRKRFSIQKFINDLPHFSKDKRATNIPILIAQMLFFIVRKQYNHAIDRIEALDKYSSRYLRNNETFRSNCFIKMLLEIPKNSFNLLRVERASEKYFRRLLDSEIDLIDQPFEIEIIPYERLWAMIMNHLRPDHHYTPKTPRTPQPTS